MKVDDALIPSDATVIISCELVILSEAGIAFLLTVCLFVCLYVCLSVRAKTEKLLKRN